MNVPIAADVKMCDAPLQPYGKSSKRLSPGKRCRGALQGRQASLQPAVGPNWVVVAAIKTEAATIKGSLGGWVTCMMLDSGSSLSLIQQDVLERAQVNRMCLNMPKASQKSGLFLNCVL